MTLEYTPDRAMPETVEDLRYWLQTELDRLSGMFSEISENYSSRLEVLTYLPTKGLMVQLEGQDTSDPLVRDDAYNVLSVVRQDVGLYRITPIQITVRGQSLAGNSYPSLVLGNTTTPETTSVEYSEGIGYFDVQILEIYKAGSVVDVRPYDLQSGEYLWVSIDLNFIDESLPPIPA